MEIKHYFVLHYKPFMNIYLLEDDEIQSIYLTSIIEKNPNYKIVGSQAHAELGISEIESLKPDVLFLDIELGDENGIEIYHSLQYKPLCILCTSHLEFALDAFELGAIDYLVKPAKPEKVFRALERAKEVLDIRKQGQSIDDVKYQSDSIFLKDGNKYFKILMSDILYIESMGDYSEFHLKNQQKKVALVSLKHLEEQLPPHLFLRISRTAILNVTHIQSAQTQSIWVAGVELHVGKTYSDTILVKILDNQLVIKRNS